MTDDDEVLACPDCDRTPVVANAPGGRSHGSSEKYRCARCGWKGDEPRRRESRGDPDLRPDSLAAKLDQADSLDELVTDGGVDQDDGGTDRDTSGRNVSAFPYIGSKTFLAPWVVENLCEHETFVVPFGGAAGVLLNKPRSRAEIFNDRDEYVVRFFEAVRDRTDELAEAVRDIPYSRGLYNEWSRRFRDPEQELGGDLVEEAARWVFLRYASFSGRYGQRAGFATDTPRKGPQKSEIWARVPERLQLLRDRFKGVAIECGDYSDQFERYDGDGVLFYCDPPYTEEKDNYYRGPLFDHAGLVETLRSVDAEWIVSYSEPPEGLEDLATAVLERSYNRSASLDNSDRPERLYCSYDPSTAQMWSGIGQKTLATTNGGELRAE